MDQLTYNIQFYLDINAQYIAKKRISELVEGEICTTLLPEQYDSITTMLKKECIDVWIADLTSYDFKNKGWSVVRASSPDLVGNFPTAFIPLNHRRISDITNNIFNFPLPHA